MIVPKMLVTMEEDNMTQDARTCSSCEKLERNGKRKVCPALSPLVGLDRPCWAWTDDPAWRIKLSRAIRGYQQGALK